MQMGGGEEVSLLHNDMEDNILSVVDGYKTVYLVHPDTPSELMQEDFNNSECTR